MINGKKVLGIIGGVGPMATVDFYQKVIQMTDATCDQEHIHILIDSNSQIPDRTESILAGNDRPVPFLIESAKRLESAGADLLVLTCNAAHYFFPALNRACSVPILNMIELAAREAKKKGFSAVGLLAVDGTLYAGTYERACRDLGLDVIKPDEEGQRRVMHLIYQEVKAGLPAHPDALCATLEDMSSRGADGFILGCTELPLVLDSQMGYSFLDPTSILAREAILSLGYRVKPIFNSLTEATL